MTQITQNNCTVKSLRPLEVICNPTNATSPETQDGSIQLFINGGTSPYTVSWNNGAQGTYIGNLQSGTYTATVTDYYEDYTETISCTVEDDTFYLDEFIKCSGSSLTSTKIYAEPLTGLVEDNVYKFTNVNGCYSYNQRLFSTGQTYSALTISNIYTGCTECEPPTPEPITQPTLCLSNGTDQYEFTPSGTNSENYFVWENTGNTLTLSYNTSLNRWEITPWYNVGIGLMVRNINEQIPTGNFINLGNSRPLTWIMTEGECEDVVPISLSSRSIAESCAGSNNGSVILTASGGYSPYQYRIQNVSPYPTYSVSGIFNNLQSGNYLGETIDDSGNTTSTVFTINQGQVGINHTVSLTSNLINSTNGSKTWNYGVQINPALPSGVSVTFDIVLTHMRKYRYPGIANFNYTHTITKNGSTNITYTSSTEYSTSTSTSCGVKPTTEYTVTFANTASSVTYSSSDTSLNGEVTQTVIIDGSGSSCLPECRMIGVYNTVLQINNLTISGNECSNVINANTPVSQDITTYDCAS